MYALTAKVLSDASGQVAPVGPRQVYRAGIPARSHGDPLRQPSHSQNKLRHDGSGLFHFSGGDPS